MDSTLNIALDDIHPVRFFRRHPFAQDIVRRLGGRGRGVALRRDDFDQLVREVMARYNEDIMTLERERRPSNMDVATAIATDVAHLVSFARSGRNTFVIADDLAQMFARTDLAAVRLSDIRLPYAAFHIAFAAPLDASLPGPDNRIDGAYVEKPHDGTLAFYVTARRTDPMPKIGPAAYIEHHEPHYFAPLPDKEGLTLEEALAAAIRSGEISVEADRDAVGALAAGAAEVENEGVSVSLPESTGHERAAARNRQGLPALRQALSVIGNVLCYLSSTPSLAAAEEAWPGATEGEQASLKQAVGHKAVGRAKGELLKKGLVPVRVLRLDPEPAVAGDRGVPAVARGPARAHWRRGHWRRQPVGPRRPDPTTERSEIRLIWIRPALVGARQTKTDGDPPIEGRVYVVSKATHETKT